MHGSSLLLRLGELVVQVAHLTLSHLTARQTVLFVSSHLSKCAVVLLQRCLGYLGLVDLLHECLSVGDVCDLRVEKEKVLLE